MKGRVCFLAAAFVCVCVKADFRFLNVKIGDGNRGYLYGQDFRFPDVFYFRQAVQNQDTMMRSNIINQHDLRRLGEPYANMLPCRRSMPMGQPKKIKRGETVVIEFESNNMHDSQCEFNLWRCGQVYTIIDQVLCFGGYDYVEFNFTLPMNFPPCEPGQCFIQWYAYSVEPRDYAACIDFVTDEEEVAWNREMEPLVFKPAKYYQDGAEHAFWNKDYNQYRGQSVLMNRFAIRWLLEEPTSRGSVTNTANNGKSALRNEIQADIAAAEAVAQAAIEAETKAERHVRMERYNVSMWRRQDWEKIELQNTYIEVDEVVTQGILDKYAARLAEFSNDPWPFSPSAEMRHWELVDDRHTPVRVFKNDGTDKLCIHTLPDNWGINLVVPQTTSPFFVDFKTIDPEEVPTYSQQRNFPWSARSGKNKFDARPGQWRITAQVEGDQGREYTLFFEIVDACRQNLIPHKSAGRPLRDVVKEGTFTATIQEGSTISFECEAGKGIRVKSAKYHNQADPDLCSYDARDFVKGVHGCEGQSSCSIRVSSANIEWNPCVGYTKNLTVVYGCDRSIFAVETEPVNVDGDAMSLLGEGTCDGDALTVPRGVEDLDTCLAQCLADDSCRAVEYDEDATRNCELHLSSINSVTSNEDTTDIECWVKVNAQDSERGYPASIETILKQPGADSHPCAENKGDCSHICREVAGQAYCTCPTGHTLSHNGKDCNDVNECFSGGNNCPQDCANTDGSFECVCYNGYSGSGMSCKDINECENGNNTCGAIGCLNTDGSFYCLDGVPDVCESYGVASKADIYNPTAARMDDTYPLGFWITTGLLGLFVAMVFGFTIFFAVGPIQQMCKAAANKKPKPNASEVARLQQAAQGGAAAGAGGGGGTGGDGPPPAQPPADGTGRPGPKVAPSKPPPRS